MHKFSADVAVNHRHKAGGDAAGVAELMIHRDNEMTDSKRVKGEGKVN